MILTSANLMPMLQRQLVLSELVEDSQIEVWPLSGGPFCKGSSWVQRVTWFKENHVNYYSDIKITWQDFSHLKIFFIIFFPKHYPFHT